MTAVFPSAMPTLPDTLTLERELGGGGMSRVFVATETALRRRVVVKVLSRELAQGLSAERFAREIALAAQLQDPHIVPVHATGTTGDGLPYFTMPYVDGESLRERLARGTVPLDEALRILRDVAEALEYAHARGVVHRDVKPANILLSGRNAVVADFGIAKAITAARGGGIDAPSLAGDRDSGTLTSVGTSLGTPAYMAPEQAVGDATDRRADLYAWGMVAFELLAGAHPFAHRTTNSQLVAAQLTEMPRALDDVRPGLPPTLGALVMRCLAKAPDQRPASATDLLGVLGTVGTSVNFDTSGSRAPVPAARLSARGKWIVTIAVVVFAVAVGWTAFGSRSTANAALEGERAMAVLPFEHQGDSADAYLTEGIADEIRGRLARVPGMAVIARGSVMQYRGTTSSPREIGKALGVRFLMTGTVRVIGTGDERRVLVRPELVEVMPDGQARSRWGEPFDLPMRDLVTVQGEVASRVVAALEVEVAPPDRAQLVEVATRDPAAYDAYLRGQAATSWGSDVSAPASQRAIPLLEEAVRRDSLLVEAWAALSRAQARSYTNGREQTVALANKTRVTAERTLALDPNGARGLIARADYRRLVVRDYDGARADLEAAVRADPTDPRVRATLGFLLVQQFARPAEAMPHLARAAALDPRTATIPLVRGEALTMLGRFDEARRAADQGVALAPSGNVQAIGFRIGVDLAAGDTVAARATMARLLGNSRDGTVLLSVAAAYAWLMDSATAARTLAVTADAYDGDRGEWASFLATAHLLRGDAVRARVWGDTALQYLKSASASNATARAILDLAFAYVAAGRPAPAVEAANRAVATIRAAYGQRRGSIYKSTLYDAAAVAAMAGTRDSTLVWLTEVLSVTTMYNRAHVRTDPQFTSLRGDPRFEALVSTPPKQPAPR